MRWIIALFVVFAAGLAAAIEFDPHIDLNLKPLKTSADRIREHGYPAESHYAVTEDGYVLNLFRIPYSPKLQNQNEKRPAVLIQHGLFSNSDCFLLNGPDNALAYNFVDQGFDVWLGNARGNIYSRNNSKIGLHHPKFWAFSWHEIGSIDIPTMIDYILEESKEEKLHYVGHSQGGTVYFVLGSFRPEYNDKLKTAHLLAPAVFMGNVTEGSVTGLAPYVGTPGSLVEKLLDNQQFVPQNPFVQRLLDTACGGNPRFPEYCHTLFLMWAGDGGNINATLLPQLAETHPAGISTNQGIHFIQLHVSNTFRRYDYGPEKNMKVYGQELPPDYPLEKITTPTHVYYGLADGSANAKDMQRLPEHLTNLKLLYQVPDPTFGHLDFIFAMEVKKEINDPVIDLCLNYEQENL